MSQLGMFASEKQVEAFVNLFKEGTKLSYKKGEYIIRPGEMPSGVFYIEKGQVKAFNVSRNGEENLLMIRREREVFPLIWAVTGQERAIIYEALVPTSVRRISRQQLLDSLHNHPENLSPMLDMAIEMYRIHSERILNLEHGSVRERLVSFLLTLSNRFGKRTDEGIVIDVPLRHQDIGSSINASRETTSRELAYLERKGFITSSGPYITLLQKEKLREFIWG